MSGPVTSRDAEPVAVPPAPPSSISPPAIEMLEGRAAEVGGTPVMRVLPKRARRTVGAWCFVDHFGPVDGPMHTGPHPHIGLQTVTWLFDGEVRHTDSLGSDQLIRGGQLNLMTAGRGVAHAEETTSDAGGTLHGLQLWVALPDASRWGDPDFEHHASLPQVEPGAGVVATVLLGELEGARSTARADTAIVGAELVVDGTAAFGLRPDFEHALVVVDGTLVVDGIEIRPGRLAYLGAGRDDLTVAGTGGARALLIGGEPFEAAPFMWWNFVGRAADEVAAAHEDWERGSDRFGPVRSGLARIPAPAPSWKVG